MENVFSTIIGYEDIKLELMRIMDQLRNPEKYAALGVTNTHGLLLHGEPGVGKSTFARCFVDHCGRKTFICRKDKPNGDFVKEISRIFDEAEANAPSLVFLDDMDKFANPDERCRDAEEFVTVQACIDRVKDKDVFVVATANNIQKLPHSLVRAGRFDHVLELDNPEGEDAHAIIAHYLSKKSYVADLDTKQIARLLEGHSCAQLENVINQAAIYAVFDGRSQIEMADMMKAILRLIFNAPEKRNFNKDSLPRIACHEAGHVLVAELLEPNSVDMVTILAHDSSAAGITSLHRDENYFRSKRLMEIRIMCLLAGKAATEICYGEVDTGANSDLRRAFNIAHRFVDHYCSYGFDQFVIEENASNEVLNRRDARIAAEIDRYYNRTRQFLMDHRPQLDALIDALLEEKTLLSGRVQELLKVA